MKLRVLLFGCLFFCVFVRVCDASEWQCWNTAAFESPIGKMYALRVEEEVHWGEDMRECIYEHTDGGFVFINKKWISVSGHYRVAVRKNAGEWETEHGPYVSGTLRTMWRWVHLSNRNEMAYRNFTDTRNYWEYRNKSKLAVRIPTKIVVYEPYVADEYCFDFDQARFNTNCFSAGCIITFKKYVTTDLYYMHQSHPGRGTHDPDDVLGVKIEYRF